jgi:hypothetical protein
MQAADEGLDKSSKRTVSQLCTSEWIVLALMTTFGPFPKTGKAHSFLQPAAHPSQVSFSTGRPRKSGINQGAGFVKALWPKKTHRSPIIKRILK